MAAVRTSCRLRLLAFAYLAFHVALIGIELGTLWIEAVHHGQVTTVLMRAIMDASELSVFMVLLCPLISVGWTLRALRTRSDLCGYAIADVLLSVLHFLFAMPGFRSMFGAP
jgi:hypothetical protein